MSRRKHEVCPGLKLAVLAPAMVLVAFGQPQPNRAAPIRPKVYVAEFNPSGPVKDSLSEFARRLFRLRFRAIPDLEVAEESETSPCGEGARGSLRSSAPGLTQPPERQTSPFVPVFYRVQGSVDEHSDSSAETQSNILLVFELVKTTSCLPTLLLRGTKTFGMPGALQNLEDAADEVSSQLSDDVAAKVSVRVDTVETVGDPKGTYQASEILTRFVRQRLADSDSFRLWDKSRAEPAYRLTGTVQFTGRGKSKAWAKVQFLVNGKPLSVPFPERTISPAAESVIPFYVEASGAVVKGLSDFFYSQRAGLNQISSKGVDALILKAKQLLCLNPAADSGGCSPDPQAALLALNEVQQKADPGSRAEVMTLIGQARFQAAEYTAAGEAYDAALAGRPSANTETRLQLLRNAGDAWYEAKDYLKAADHYRTCVETGGADPSLPTPIRLQSAARVKLIHSLTLADRPDVALDALLDGIRAARSLPNSGDKSNELSNELISELSSVLGALPTKQLESARSKLESQLAYDPGLEASALNQISRRYAHEGRYKEAVVGYRKALALKPGDALAHFDLGFALASLGDVDEAIGEYRNAISLKPDDAIAHNNLGVSLSQKRKPDEAIREFRKAIDIKPDYVLALNNLALSLSDIGQYEKAQDAYQQAIRARPDDTTAYYNLWWLYRSLSKEEDARKVFQNLQKAAPGDHYTQLILAILREGAEDFDGAAAIYSKLHDQDPQNSFYSTALAEAEIKAGMKNHDRERIQKVMRGLELEVANNPTYANCFSLAWVYETLPQGQGKDLDKAEKLYEKSLTYRPGNRATLINLSVVAFEKGDSQGLIKRSEQVLKMNSRDPIALENLGYGKFLMSDFEGAIQAYETVLQVAPDQPVTLVSYGEALLWSANTRKAHEQFGRARSALSGANAPLDTWGWLVDSRYDATEKQRVVNYSTSAQKRAMIELFDALTYLREMEIASALARFRAATGMLTVTSDDDKEVVRKAINDLHRLEKESLAQPTAQFGLGYLYDWLGETARAARFWEIYLRSGTDLVGLEEARRRLARR